MDTKIKKLLEESRIKYKSVEHRKVYTAFNEAETQHLDPKTVVKTVLVKFSRPFLVMLEQHGIKETDFALIAVPAQKRVDFKKIAKFANDYQTKIFKKLSKSDPKLKKPATVTVKMAGEKDITNKLKTKVGLLTAFSQIYHLPLLLDKKLTKNKKLVVSAGVYTESVEISTKDFLKLMVGMEGNFTE